MSVSVQALRQTGWIIMNNHSFIRYFELFFLDNFLIIILLIVVGRCVSSDVNLSIMHVRLARPWLCFIENERKCTILTVIFIAFECYSYNKPKTRLYGFHVFVINNDTTINTSQALVAINYLFIICFQEISKRKCELFANELTFCQSFLACQ